MRKNRKCRFFIQELTVYLFFLIIILLPIEIQVEIFFFSVKKQRKTVKKNKKEKTNIETDKNAALSNGAAHSLSDSAVVVVDTKASGELPLASNVVVAAFSAKQRKIRKGQCELYRKDCKN